MVVMASNSPCCRSFSNNGRKRTKTRHIVRSGDVGASRGGLCCARHSRMAAQNACRCILRSVRLSNICRVLRPSSYTARFTRGKGVALRSSGLGELQGPSSFQASRTGEALGAFTRSLPTGSAACLPCERDVLPKLSLGELLGASTRSFDATLWSCGLLPETLSPAPADALNTCFTDFRIGGTLAFCSRRLSSSQALTCAMSGSESMVLRAPGFGVPPLVPTGSVGIVVARRRFSSIQAFT
mmetsp:Transcript_34905/g.96355  ORF Transcript_34905/g.96355 Transcript_34905/m.96355 type:complete len:241 (+) Transcript_34905:1086-1808(+)